MLVQRLRHDAVLARVLHALALGRLDLGLRLRVKLADDAVGPEVEPLGQAIAGVPVALLVWAVGAVRTSVRILDALGGGLWGGGVGEEVRKGRSGEKRGGTGSWLIMNRIRAMTIGIGAIPDRSWAT